MPANGTVEAAEAATTAIEEKIRGLLAPLLSDRDQLLSEEAELQDELDAKRAERKAVEKALRGSDLIASKSKQKRAKAKAIAPQAPGKLSKQAEKAQETILKAIKELDGKPFQIGMIERRFKVRRALVERVIGVMRGEDRIRLLGNRPQMDRSPDAPGGRPAATFQEIR